MDKLSCAVAGNNPQRFKFKYNEQAQLCRSIKTMISEQIKRLYGKGVKTFYIGCAVGVDTWTAEIIIDLKQQVEFSDLELICTIPFPEHAEKFKEGQKKRYQEILSHCTDKEVINRHFSPVAYKRLNYYMVDKSQYLLTVYDQDKSERSGLVQMVNYAKKNNLRIIFIHPDTAEASEYTP